MFNKPFSFSGRIGRLEYAISFVIYNVALFFELTNQSKNNVLVFYIGYFFILWFSWAQGAKRSHDIGTTGWLQLIPFYNLLLLFKAGDLGTNRYGESPRKERENDIPQFRNETNKRLIDEYKNYAVEAEDTRDKEAEDTRDKKQENNELNKRKPEGYRKDVEDDYKNFKE